MSIRRVEKPRIELRTKSAKGESMYPNLKFELWRSGMRQNRLAQMLKLDETVLSRIVNGFRKPCPEVMAKVAAALKRDQEWLFEESAPEQVIPRQVKGS
jgi:transcriptional regulator with XRE-family HTH domain